jgi:hypothetical protein
LVVRVEIARFHQHEHHGESDHSGVAPVRGWRDTT